MSDLALDIALEVVKAIVGVVIPALTVWLMFHTKRINDNMKKNNLQNKIDQLSQRSDQLQSFQTMMLEERIEALMETARLYAEQNQLNISNTELRIMVEGSLNTIRTLDRIILKLERKNE